MPAHPSSSAHRHHRHVRHHDRDMRPSPTHLSLDTPSLTPPGLGRRRGEMGRGTGRSGGSGTDDSATFTGYDGPAPMLYPTTSDEYVARPHNPYNLPPASIIVVELGSQSASPRSLSDSDSDANAANAGGYLHPRSGFHRVEWSGVYQGHRRHQGSRSPRMPDNEIDLLMRGRSTAQKKIHAGVHRLRAAGGGGGGFAKARHAGLSGRKREGGRLSPIWAGCDENDGGRLHESWIRASWDSKDFVDPRPAPEPPTTGTSPLLFPRPPTDGLGLFANDLDTRFGRSDKNVGGHPNLQRTSECVIPPLSPVPQQPTPAESVQQLNPETPLSPMLKQVLGRKMMPLPTVSATVPIATGTPGLLSAAFSRRDSVDSSMDKVYIQIQDCLAATDRMDETLCSCNYINYSSMANICVLLRRALREMQKSIDLGSPRVELNTPEKMMWKHKHDDLEFSVQKNVRKYFQLATQTWNKPPRITHLSDRMDKLKAYLRKFRDLNLRILASFDKLRILELHGRLLASHTAAKQRKEDEMARHHRWNEEWRKEKTEMHALKKELRVMRDERERRLRMLKDPAFARLDNVV